MLSALIVERTVHGHGIGAVIVEAPVKRIDFKHNGRTYVSAAGGVGFTNVILLLAVNKLSRRRVGYINVHRFRSAQQAGVNHIHFVNGTAGGLVVNRNGRLIVAGINLGIEIGHIVKIRTERYYILIVVIKSQRSGL